MKQSFLILGGFLIFLGLGSITLKGVEPPEEGINGTTREPAVTQAPVAVQEPVKSLPKPEAIRPMGEVYLRDRINELERRVSQLEQDIRFFEDETRSLDRRIDDLRQRHV